MFYHKSAAGETFRSGTVKEHAERADVNTHGRGSRNRQKFHHFRTKNGVAEAFRFVIHFSTYRSEIQFLFNAAIDIIQAVATLDSNVLISIQAKNFHSFIRVKNFSPKLRLFFHLRSKKQVKLC